MNEILKRLFERRGIKNLEELSEDEKRDYDRWQRILSEGEVSVESIRKFCYNQVVLIEGKFKEMDVDEKVTQRRVLLHSVYKSILSAIEAPRQEREQLEKYLNSLI